MNSLNYNGEQNSSKEMSIVRHDESRITRNGERESRITINKKRKGN